MKDWTHPRIANPTVAIENYEDIADEAQRALDRRREAYPALVERGRILADEAAADIAAWEIIAADWRYIADGTGAPLERPGESVVARTAAIDTALDRWFAQVDRSGGGLTPELAEQGALIAAMRWWIEREAQQRWNLHARPWATVGHEWRVKNGHACPSETERKAA